MTITSQVWIGIDNGVSGSIGWVDSEGRSGFKVVPTFSGFNYQKAGKKIARIDTASLNNILYELVTDICSGTLRLARAYVERPMVNPKRFTATASALRALEATLIVLEELDVSYEYLDSKHWQKKLLPKVKGSPNLKRASKEIGCRLFPSLSEKIQEHGDADGILIAEYAKRTIGSNTSA